MKGQSHVGSSGVFEGNSTNPNAIALRDNIQGIDI